MKNFDFEAVGKNVPYDMPNDFLSKSSAKVLERISSYEKKRINKKRIVVIYYAAAVFAMGIVAGITFYSQKSNQQIDYVLKHLSDSDLQKLKEAVTSDPFY